jgi:hypothetical protein
MYAVEIVAGIGYGSVMSERVHEHDFRTIGQTAVSHYSFQPATRERSKECTRDLSHKRRRASHKIRINKTPDACDYPLMMRLYVSRRARFRC